MRVWRAAILIVLITAWGCSKQPIPPAAGYRGLPNVDPQPETPIAPPTEVVSVPVGEPPSITIPEPPPRPLPPAMLALDDADRAFGSADYARATARYEEYLRLAPEGDQRDRVQFQLGLSYALPENPQRDWKRALTYFTQLANDARSPYQQPARIVMLLRNEVTQLAGDKETLDKRVRQLNSELERLKQIDAERLRR